jgi:hypothetical protein
MRNDPQARLENAENHFNGLRDEKGFDLLREAVKGILDERRTKPKTRRKPKFTARWK